MSIATDIFKALRADPTQILELTDEQVDGLTETDMHNMQVEFGATVLMRLPPRERAFMEWLEEADPGVYDDLWGEDELFLVSLSFLPNFRKDGHGFLICELEEHHNYFFTPKHIRREGTEALQDIFRKLEKKEELSIEEVLMFEVVRIPVDIWHFCYQFGIPVNRGKKAAQQLAAHGWLVHLTKSEDLTKYIEE
jgi:hypothetical protein